MARRPANITQAEVHVGDRDKIIIRISSSTGTKIALEDSGEIIL
jgi:hypothetical protein